MSSSSHRSSLNGLFVGFTYPLRALGILIKVPRLRQYVLLPILLNLVLGVTLYAGLLITGFAAIDALLNALPAWIASARQLEIEHSAWITTLPHWAPSINRPDWLPSLPQFNISLPLPDEWPTFTWPQITIPPWVTNLPAVGLTILTGLLRFFLVVMLLLVTGFVLLQFGVLLGAPWYGQLSEELEKLQTGELHTIAINPVREIGRAVLYELKKLMLTIGIGVPLLLGNFFPGVGTIGATVGGITLAATIVCLDFLDSTLERRRLEFRQKLSLIWQSLPASASFALVCLGLVSIPFLNLLAIPVCVAAGTLFACERVLPLLSGAQNLPTKSKKI